MLKELYHKIFKTTKTNEKQQEISIRFKTSKYADTEKETYVEIVADDAYKILLDMDKDGLLNPNRKK